MKLQLLGLQWHINIMETVTRIRNRFNEALLHVLWLHTAIKGPGCQQKTVWCKPHFFGDMFNQVESLSGKFTGQMFPLIFMGFATRLLKHMLHTVTQVIPVEGSPVLPAPWSSDVQHEGSPGRTGEGHHNWGPRSPKLTLQVSNLREHEFGRSAHHLFYGKKGIIDLF